MTSSLSRSLFTSAKQTWETPDDLFAELNAEFAFTVDVCALPETAKVARHWSPQESAMWQRWAGETCGGLLFGLPCPRCAQLYCANCSPDHAKAHNAQHLGQSVKENET